MASLGQLEALISFMEQHKDLALGRCSRTKEGRSLAKRLWTQCADELNSISPDCRTKSADNWRLFYNEYKSKILRKIKKQKAEHQATGGGPATHISLTPLQERLYNILGRDVGEPLEGVRHNPLIGHEHTTISPEELHEIPFAEYQDITMLGFETEYIEPPQEFVCPVEPANSVTSTIYDSIVEPIVSPQSQSIAEPTMSQSGSMLINTDSHTVEPATATPTPYAREPQRQRLNRRRLPRSHLMQHGPNAQLEEAQRSIMAFESQSATATIQLAQCISQLAAAVENLATALSHRNGTI